MIKPSTSSDEIIVYFYVKRFFPEAINRYRFASSSEGTYEADVFIPSINVAIEYDGYFWHKDKYDRDVKKTVFLNNGGIYVIHIRETGLDSLPQFIGREFWHKKRKTGRGLHTNEYITLMINDLAQFCDYEKARELASFSLSYEQHKLNLPTINSLIYDTVVPNSVADSPALLYWDYEKNGPLNPKHIPMGTDIRVYLRCPANNSISVNVTTASQQQKYFPSSKLSKYICILFGRIEICKERCSLYNEEAKKCVDSVCAIKPVLCETDYLWLQRNAFNEDEIIRYILNNRLEERISREDFCHCFLDANRFLHASTFVNITSCETLKILKKVQDMDGFFFVRFDATRFDDDQTRQDLFDYLAYALCNIRNDFRGTYLNEIFCTCVQKKEFLSTQMQKGLKRIQKKFSIETISPQIDQYLGRKQRWRMFGFINTLR